MDLEARKRDFVKEFLQFQSEEVIKKFERFLKKTKEEESERNMTPLSIEEFRARIQGSLDDFEKGRVISNDALMNEYKQWR